LVKITNVFGDRYSGQAGHAGVFANWKGIQYRRAYVKPSNPNTNKQKAVRDNLSLAVALWHTFNTVQRRAYGYMCASLKMSGFNLFTSRFQKAMPDSLTEMVQPPYGIKCIGNTLATHQHLNPAPTQHAYTLGYNPCVIGSLTFTKANDDEITDAYCDIQQGKIRLPLAISTADGAKGLGAALEEGDQLCVSYTSSGRIVTREVLAQLGEGETSFPAAATMLLALITQYAPIDFGSFKLEVHDVDGGVGEWTQLETIEIDSLQGIIYYDLTDAADASSHVDYDSYTPVESVKLEAMKSDTSFVAYREYSDVNGQIELAFTIEDETYDIVCSKTGHTSVIASAKTALLASLTEFIDIGTES
jgi:hypothetical protein